MQIEITTRQYVEHSFRGSFVTDTSSIEVVERNPEQEKNNLPEYAFAFRFYSRTEAVIDGEKLVGKPKDRSSYYYPNSKVWTTQELIEAKKESTLITNCENNGGKVVQCNMGNWQIFNEDDKII
jgi:RNase P/RNase MRP subunit p29